MKDKWETVDDDDVQHIWQRTCDCEGSPKEVQVTPDYYEINGEPICGLCGKGYAYARTQVWRRKSSLVGSWVNKCAKYRSIPFNKFHRYMVTGAEGIK